MSKKIALQVRLPQWLHARLKRHATKYGVSLNGLIVTLLAFKTDVAMAILEAKISKE